MFKAIKQMFDDRQHKVDFLAANIFTQMVRQCPPPTAARASYDYAEAFVREMEKRHKRNGL